MRLGIAGVGVAVALLASACGSSTTGADSAESPAPSAAATAEQSAAASEAPPAETAECGSGEAVTLKWQNWISQEEASKAFSEAAVAAFQAKCPNITIEVVGVPAEKTADALVLAASSKSGADIFQTQTYWTAQFTDLGLFRPIETLDDVKADMVPAAVAAGTYNDQWTDPVWGLAPFILTYNKNVLKDAGYSEADLPTTWDELYALTADIGAKGDGNTFGYCQDSGKGYLNGFWTLNLIQSYGGQFYTDGAASMESPEMKAAFDAYQKWYQTPGAWAQGIDVRQCRDLFSQNKVAFNFESSWATGIYRTGSGQGEAFDDQWGAIVVPNGPNGLPGVAADANQGLAVATYTEHPAEAEAFIRFMLTDPEITTEYLKVVGFPTPVKSLWTTSPLYEEPLTQLLLAGAESSASPQSPKLQDLVTKLGESLQVVANGGSVDEELAKLQVQFTEALD
jgi:ABC-type glycerol-3-phosphate transport system substrate-binding protein